MRIAFVSLMVIVATAGAALSAPKPQVASPAIVSIPVAEQCCFATEQQCTSQGYRCIKVTEGGSERGVWTGRTATKWCFRYCPPIKGQ
jgi:hypothetical protein